MLCPEARASLKCLDFLTFNQPLNIRWNSPAAGYEPRVSLSFINHIFFFLLPFTGPVYLFPSSPHSHHCRKAHRNIDGECVQTFFDAVHTVALSVNNNVGTGCLELSLIHGNTLQCTEFWTSSPCVDTYEESPPNVLCIYWQELRFSSVTKLYKAHTGHCGGKKPMYYLICPTLRLEPLFKMSKRIWAWIDEDFTSFPRASIIDFRVYSSLSRDSFAAGSDGLPALDPSFKKSMYHVWLFGACV